MGVGVDGLQVGEEDDDQQADDGEADGYDVLNARQTQAVSEA